MFPLRNPQKFLLLQISYNTNRPDLISSFFTSIIIKAFNTAKVTKKSPAFVLYNNRVYAPLEKWEKISNSFQTLRCFYFDNFGFTHLILFRIPNLLSRFANQAALSAQLQTKTAKVKKKFIFYGKAP